MRSNRQDLLSEGRLSRECKHRQTARRGKRPMMQPKSKKMKEAEEDNRDDDDIQEWDRGGIPLPHAPKLSTQFLALCMVSPIL